MEAYTRVRSSKATCAPMLRHPFARASAVTRARLGTAQRSCTSETASCWARWIPARAQSARRSRRQQDPLRAVQKLRPPRPHAQIKSNHTKIKFQLKFQFSRGTQTAEPTPYLRRHDQVPRDARCGRPRKADLADHAPPLSTRGRGPPPPPRAQHSGDAPCRPRGAAPRGHTCTCAPHSRMHLQVHPKARECKIPAGAIANGISNTTNNARMQISRRRTHMPSGPAPPPFGPTSPPRSISHHITVPQERTRIPPPRSR